MSKSQNDFRQPSTLAADKSPRELFATVTPAVWAAIGSLSQSGRILIFTLGVFLISQPGYGLGPQEDGKTQAESKLPSRLDEMLWWFPADTQTVGVCQGPFSIAGMGPQPEPDAPEPITDVERTKGQRVEPGVVQAPKPPASRPITLESQLRCFALGPLYLEHQKGSNTHLSTHKISMTIEGSRRFRLTEDLGMQPYDGATLIVFSEDLGADGRAFFASLKATAKKLEQIAGREVIILGANAEIGPSDIFVVQAQPEILLWATDRTYLAEVLERITRRARDRALPPDLPEWAHLDVTAPFWAVRHFDRKDARLDPTSPLAGRKQPANTPDDGAIGLVIAYTPASRRLVSHYLSTNPAAKAVLTDRWGMLGEDRVQAEFQTTSRGVARLVADLRTPTSNIALLLILQALGHSVSL